MSTGRLRQWCEACAAPTALIVGKRGEEVRDCTRCGRRRSLHAELVAKRRAARWVHV